MIDCDETVTTQNTKTNNTASAITNSAAAAGAVGFFKSFFNK